ncbi:hypothetical protein [Parabacteroides chinchillae]|uniref:hypothetical protein n=1 Tax=Parabacteroides chinchillae TaxID=871327 RepID=UPI0011B0B553|nr:hypothetical protein [Parabacteroides chinchillae]
MVDAYKAQSGVSGSLVGLSLAIKTCTDGDGRQASLKAAGFIRTTFLAESADLEGVPAQNSIGYQLLYLI